MTLPQFRAFLLGYEDHLLDLKCLTAYAGYWAGYYSNTKKPRSLSSILKDLVNNHREAKRRKGQARNIERPEVDVDEFLRREKQFRERLRRR